MITSSNQPKDHHMLINAAALSTVNGCVEDLFNVAYYKSPFGAEMDATIKEMVLNNYLMGAYVTATGGKLDRYMVEKFVTAVNGLEQSNGIVFMQTLMADAFTMGMYYAGINKDVGSLAIMMKV